MKKRQDLPDFPRLLGFFELDDRPQPRSRRQRKFLLSDAQSLARLLDKLAYVSG